MSDPVEVSLPCGRKITISKRTPRAVVAAARKLALHLDVSDLRDFAAWTEWCGDSFWDASGGPAGDKACVSVTGALALYIACGIFDVETPDDVEAGDELRFMRQVWRLAPKTTWT